MIYHKEKVKINKIIYLPCFKLIINVTLFFLNFLKANALFIY